MNSTTVKLVPHINEKSNQKKVKAAGFGWSSRNWSGYAIARSKGSMNSIAGEWIVPRVTSRKPNSFSSVWIGIDGFNNNSLIQTGTEQDYYNGSAHYYAWWEILPAVETRIPFRVSPGDHMRAEIYNLGRGKWSITLTNNTKHWTFSIDRFYKGPQSSAEWIVEAPQVNGRIATLADYGKTSFRNCSVNGSNPRLVKYNGGVMTQQNVRVSTPSAPNRNGNGFVVVYGSSTPQPPVSATRNKGRILTNKTKPLLLTKNGV